MGRATSKKKDKNRSGKKQHRRSARLAALTDTSTAKPPGEGVVAEAGLGAANLDLEIKLASPLPSSVMVGRKLDSPIVAVFSQNAAKLESSELDNVWVFASLLDSEGQPLSGDDPLRGPRADSLHVVAEGGNSHENEVARASFSDLTFSKPGSYRLRLTTIDQRGAHPGRILPALTSAPFEVVTTVGKSAPRRRT